MNNVFRITLLLLITNQVLQAQSIKGRITNQSGDPIQYSTVYIQELRQGTTSNTKGFYELKIPPGKYTVIYQSLGYEPVSVTISLSDNTISKDVVLPVQYYQIPEVRISASGEDPAYIIMRKVIGLAPYYLNNISYYKADVYLKGNLVINKIPKLLQRSMKVQSRSDGATLSAGEKPEPKEKVLKEGDAFMMETYNEVEFNAPDKYVQKVISYNSTFPEQGNEISPMDFIQASFYQPVIANLAISPLSPQAFSYYRFRYLGASPQGNFTINKVEVKPKIKSQQTFEGIIYIIEDLWCLHSVDLTNDNLVGKIRVQQLYIPVEGEIWMPVSHKFEISIGIMGFKADASYASSVKYVEVKPNLALKKPETISTDYKGRNNITVAGPDTSSTKTKKQINKILQKQDLSNRDMIKLSRLMTKESELAMPDSTRNNLEIKDNTTQIIEKDAAKKDSAYWAEIRPIPLSEIEMKSLKVRDSLNLQLLAKDSKADSTVSNTKKKSGFGKSVNNLVSGHTWADTTGLSFTFGGVLNLKRISFNTVDGFVYGSDFRISKKWKNNNSLALFPDVRWAFSRERLLWRINGAFNFDMLSPKQIFFRSGITSADVNNRSGINPLLNSGSSLLFRKNYLKLYETRYFILGYKGEVVNGLNIEFRAGYEERRVLNNTTSYSFFYRSRDYTPNIPVNDYLAAGSNPLNALHDQRQMSLTTNLSFTPRQKYSINNNVKTTLGSDWPVFTLTWKHGINESSDLPGGFKHFDMIKFDVNKHYDMGAFSEFRWIVRTGGFLNNKGLSFYDFFHFNAQSIPFLIDNYQDAFMLPAYYSLSTPEIFGETHIKYTTPYLLLKYLPGLSNTLIRENLSLSWLGSRSHSNYSEIGYSISEVFLLAELGVYVGFDDIKYKSVGAKLIIRFN